MISLFKSAEPQTAASFFDLRYTEHEGWVATLGAMPGHRIDPDTGKEDFSEQRRVREYLENWRPTEPWIPQEICLHFEDEGRPLKRADRVFDNAVGPIFSENAVQKMRSFIDESGYALELKVMNVQEHFYLFWVPWLAGSVDFDCSQKTRDNRFVTKYALNPTIVRGRTAFRPHYEGAYKPEAQGTVLVSDEFRQAWIAAGLTGIEFKEATIP